MVKNYKFYLLVFSVIIVTFLIGRISMRSVSAGIEKIPLCHVTASETNRYVYIEVAPSAVDGEGKNDHTHHVQYDSENNPLYDLWTGDGRGSVINRPEDCPGEAVVNEETHALKLDSICRDDINEERRWRVLHQDESDLFYPVTLGYEIYSGPILTLTEPFTFNHNFTNRFLDPYLFTTQLTGESQTVKLYWYNVSKGEWIEDDTKAANNIPCYEKCTETESYTGEWSKWMIDPKDETQEYSERETYLVDKYFFDYQCSESEIEKKYQDIEIDYCESTIDGATVWSSWTVDPNDDTQEMRTGVVSLWDAEDNTHDCGTREIVEYQDIQKEGDILGEATKKEEGEVLGTSIVYAQTAGGESNLIVYLIQFILVIATGYSLKLVGKKYLTL